MGGHRTSCIAAAAVACAACAAACAQERDAPIRIETVIAFDLYLFGDPDAPGRYALSPEPEGFALSAGVLRAYLTEPEVWPPDLHTLRIADTVFADPLDLSQLDMHVALEFERCRFEGGITLDESHWTRPVTFRASFADAFSAVSARFDATMRLDRIECAGAVDLTGAYSAEELVLRGVRTADRVVLAGASAEGDIRLSGLRCAAIDAAGLRSGKSLVLAGCRMRDDVDLTDAVAAEFIVFSRSRMRTLEMPRAQVSIRVGLDGLKAESANLSGARIGHKVVLADFSGSFDQAHWLGANAKLDLSNAVVRELELPHLGLPPVIDLRGLAYTRLRPKCFNCENDPAKTAAFVLERLERQGPRDASVVATAIARLREQGDAPIADALAYAQLESVRRNAETPWALRAWMQADRLTTGYGYFPGRLGWWTLSWVATYLALIGLASPRTVVRGFDFTADGLRGVWRLVYTAYARLVFIPLPRDPSPKGLYWVTHAYRAAGLTLIAIGLLAWMRTSPAAAAFIR